MVKTKNPTAPRMAAKPIEATITVGRWVSAYSTSSGTSVLRGVGCSWLMIAADVRKNTAAAASTHGAPNQRKMRPPTTAPAPPNAPLTRASRAYVATSWSGSSVTSGTRACLTTPEALLVISRMMANR